MKKTIIILLIFGIAGYVVYFLYNKNKAKNLLGNVATDPSKLPPPPPPPPPPSDGKTILSDTPEGIAIVSARMKSIYSSDFVSAQKSNYEADIRKGISSPGFIATTGGAGSLLLPLTTDMQKDLAFAANLFLGGNFEQRAGSIGKANLNFSYSGVPQFLPENARGGGSKDFAHKWLCPNYAGCPTIKIPNWNSAPEKIKKDYYDALDNAASDVRNYANNVLAIAGKIENNVRNKAISDLQNTGWKIV